jgi:hypothetical protein
MMMLNDDEDQMQSQPCIASAATAILTPIVHEQIGIAMRIESDPTAHSGSSAVISIPEAGSTLWGGRTLFNR